MKNGFTLVELLGVIFIISVLALITVPLINSTLNKGKQNLSSVQEEQLKKGLKDYYSSNLSELSSLPTGKTCKSVSEIQSSGYLPSDIKDPSTNRSYDVSSVKVCVNKTIITCTSHLDSSCYNYEYAVE